MLFQRDLGIAGAAVTGAIFACAIIDEVATPDPGPEPPLVVVALTLIFLAVVIVVARYGTLRAAVITAVLGWAACRWIFFVPPGSSTIQGIWAQIAISLYLVAALIVVWLSEEFRARRKQRAPSLMLVAAQRACGTVLVCDVARQRFLEIRDI